MLMIQGTAASSRRMIVACRTFGLSCMPWHFPKAGRFRFESHARITDRNNGRRPIWNDRLCPARLQMRCMSTRSERGLTYLNGPSRRWFRHSRPRGVIPYSGIIAQSKA